MLPGTRPSGAVLDPQWHGQCRWRENEQVTGDLLDNFGGVEEGRPPSIEIHSDQRPYRQPVDFNQVMIDDSVVHHGRLVTCYGEGLAKKGSADWRRFSWLEEATSRFESGMDDDFNTRGALVEVQSVAKRMRGLLDSGGVSEEIAGAVRWISEYAGGVLGLLPEDAEVLRNMKRQESAKDEISQHVESLLLQRNIARESKDWARADEIRDELTGMGIIVEDGPGGATWRIE